MIRNWWPKWLVQRSLPLRKGPRQPVSKSARLQPTQLFLELLEDRVVPSAGTLDSTFGTGGMVVTPISNGFDQANAVVSLANGSILAAGQAYSNTTGYDFAVAKYQSNGTLDPSFGSGGLVTTDFFGFTDVAHAMAVLPNGNIVVAGTAFNPATGNEFALAEYTSAGVLVSGFGSGGLVTTGFFGGGDDEAFDLAVQSDGKIVVGGYAYNPGTESNDFALARYNADGTLDSTFGSGGLATTGFAVNDDEIQGLAIQPDGMIVAAGFAFTGASYEFAVARYTTAGALDPTFGTGGTVTTDFAGNDDYGYAVALESSGDILVGGTATVPSTGTDFALAAYTPSGSLDGTFGTGGLVTTEFSGTDDEIRALAFEANGQILAGGYTSNGTNYDFALARYNTDGTVDTSFNPATSGLVTTNFNGGSDLAYEMSVQPSGAIVLAGAVDDGSGNTDFGLARYLGDPTNVLTGSSGATATGGVAGANPATLANATFTDSNTSAPASDFTVSAVAWGDGSTNTSGLTITGSGGSYMVNGTHLYNQAGNYNFTITVTDAGATATITGTATVVNSVAITTTTLASYVTATVPGYNQTIATTGGIAPITFAVSAGSLPAGLNLNTSTGVISGTPTTAGTSAFTVTATDSTNGTASQPYTVVVIPAAFVLNPTTGALTVTGNDFEFTEVTQAVGAGTSTVYTFTIDNVSQSFPDTVVKTASIVSPSQAGTAILVTNDTYQANGVTEETRESISLGSKTNAGAGTMLKFDANGDKYTFLTLSGFPTSYAYVGRNDGSVLLYGTAGVAYNAFVSAGNYSYIVGPGIYHEAQGATSVYAYSSGQASDYSYQYSANPGSAYYVSGTAYSYMSAMDTVNGVTQAYFNVGVGFAINTGVSMNPGKDIAYIIDSPGNDTFVGQSAYSYMYIQNANGSFAEFDAAYGFALVFGQSFMGGTDTATNYDPSKNILGGNWIVE